MLFHFLLPFAPSAFIMILQWWFNLLLVFLTVAIVFIVYLLVLSYRARKKLIRTKDMLRVQLEIQDLTFSAISREVHDNVGQILSLAKVQLNLLSEDSAKNGDLLDQAKENISNALIDLREIAKSLSNKKLISLGLFSSIQHEARRMNDTGEWDVQVAIEGNPLPVTETQHLVIFRAIQYFLNRIAQMEGPKKMTITLAFHQYDWQVRIIHSRIDSELDQEQEQRILDEQSLILRRLSIIGATFTKTNNGTFQILIHIPYA